MKKRKLRAPEKRKERHVIKNRSDRQEIAKELFHGKTPKQVMYDHDLSLGAVQNIFHEFINWQMVWKGDPFQEELGL